MEHQMQLTADDAAAEAAERLIKSSSPTELPKDRKTAEGGFTEAAGGTLIDAGQKGTETMKSQKVGSAITSEPKGDGGPKVTGSAITDEPDRQTADSGSGGSLDENDDARARKRKAGQIGVSGGTSAKKNLSEDEDAKTRARKEGKVGIGKSEDADEDDDEVQKCGMKKAGGGQFTPQQTKIKGGPFGKSEDEDEDDEPEEDEEKSLIDVGDLMKSMDTHAAIAEGAELEAPRDRLAELAEGLSAGTLSKSDYQELHDLTKAEIEPEMFEETTEDDAQEPVQKSYQETFATDPTLSEGYDVSPFLERQNQLLAASLDQMQDQLMKAVAPGRVRAFNVALSKSLRGMASLAQQQGELIKSLTDRLEQVENTPLPRKGVSNVRVLQKSMRGEVGAEGPSKDQVLDAILGMAMKSERSPSGEPLMRAVAQLEAGGEISKSLMKDVRDYMQKNNG